MYELKAGTERIITALICVTDSPYDINRMSAVLNYTSEQLKQDIQALSDYYRQTKDKK